MRGIVTLMKALTRIIALVAMPIAAQQMADPNFKPKIENPTYARAHPVVAIDEAHSNFHTVNGRYKPFADLLRADGYNVTSSTQVFGKNSLKGIDILVIANAISKAATEQGSPSAFTADECDAVRAWVRGGGSLLLIADHTPYGGAAEKLGQSFGVEMGKGYAFDLKNSDRGPTTLVYSRENGLLGEHPITQGVNRVVAFTGQSLTVPAGATPLLKFSPAAMESPNGRTMQEDLPAVQAGKPSNAKSVAGRAQGIALNFGKGRVVMTGEAAMFSAQVVRFTNEKGESREMFMGMNLPGNDNQQFLLNLIHWLTRRKP
jgi:hypothetical protein